MEFFIDTADIGEIKKAVQMGMVDGVTTNPSLVANTGKPFDTVMKEIFKVVDGPINLEVLSLKAGGMLREAKELVKYGDNAVIKIPMCVEGMKAVAKLTAMGVKTNVTLIFSPLQALMAAKAGATYVSRFVGRLDDINQPGMDLIDKILTIYSNFGYETNTLVASIRSPMHVLDSALMGADVVTIPFKVLNQLAAHPLTDKGIAAFLKDAKKIPKAKKKK